jgi:hypothetical protein
MLRALFLLIVAVMVVGKCAAAPDQQIVFKDENFQCQVPGDWAVAHTDVPKFAFDAQRPDFGTFLVHATPTQIERVDVLPFMTAFKAKLVRDGHEILSEDTNPFKGCPAYSCSFRKIIEGNMVYSHCINFVAGKIRYSIAMAQEKSDPFSSPDFQAILTSFTILSPAK